MNKSILKADAQDFINKNLNADILSVLLKKQIFKDISQKELVQQLEAKKKCKKKLPTWFKTPGIYYPKKVNIEQSSSEIAASYKSRIIDGKSVLDLTGGLGVDSYFFSKKMENVQYVEIDASLSQIAKHNFDVLGTKNIDVFTGNGIPFLEKAGRTFDWIYLDPSRRHPVKGRVFQLSDYSPDPLEHIGPSFEKSNGILLKTAPLLDLTAGTKALRYVSEIHVVAINNEVKELLWKLEKGFSGPPVVKTINFRETESEVFDFLPEEERTTTSNFSEPLEYLYEPNSAILKAGAFKLVGERFSLSKLHEHSHLYTSGELREFPGRVFIIEGLYVYSKKVIKSLHLSKCTISTRNFPERVEHLRKLFKLRPGGETHLFFTKTKLQGAVVIKCRKAGL